MKKYIIGIDIGGTTIKFGIFDLTYKLLEKWQIPTNTKQKGKMILTEIYQSIASRIDFSLLKGIGFGVPGIVLNDTVYEVSNIGWDDFPLLEKFQELLQNPDIKITVSNDANLASLGESRYVCQSYESSCMITVGTGIGGGLIIHDKLITGGHGFAGEFGHMMIDNPYLFPCNCGSYGCLETLASSTGILNLTDYFLTHMATPSKLRNHSLKITSKDVFDYAKDGDLLSNQIIDEAVYYLAKALTYISYVFDPKIFILGGGITNAGTFYLDKIKHKYSELVQPSLKNTIIQIAHLGNDAGIYGAAYTIE